MTTDETGQVDALQRVVSALVDLSDGFGEADTVSTFLRHLTRSMVGLLTTVDAAGAIVVEDGVVIGLAATPDRFTHLLALQIEADAGPSIRCLRTGQPVGVRHPATGSTFGTACLRAGFGSTHVVPMRTNGRTIGSLSLFRRAPSALDRTAAVSAQALADTAAVCLRQRHSLVQSDIRVRQLQEALHSRVLIEQAKGMVAERAGLAPDDAFTAIRAYARQRGMRLRQVAQLIVARALDLDLRS